MLISKLLNLIEFQNQYTIMEDIDYRNNPKDQAELFNNFFGDQFSELEVGAAGSSRRRRRFGISR